MQFLERTARLIGDAGVKILKKSHVAIFGCGGVGGYVAEMLARSGVGHFTLIDFDKVDVTNINRQILALHSTIGMYKVDVLKERIKDINPTCTVDVFCEKFDGQSAEKLLHTPYDMVVDAIDMVDCKCLLIENCIHKNIPIISAMGAGRRKDIPHFEVTDVYKTTNDGLAKVVRRKLRAMGITHHLVVSTTSKPVDTGEEIGSISYYPAMCGCVLAGYVINYFIDKEIE